NIAREKIYKHFRKTFDIVRSDYHHFLQHLITASKLCLDRMQRYDEEITEINERDASQRQQALESHETLFDILSEFLDDTREMNQYIMDLIVDFQDRFARGRKRISSQGLLEALIDALLVLLAGPLMSNLLLFRLFPWLALIPMPIIAIGTGISTVYTAAHFFYRIYLDHTVTSQMQHLEQELQDISTEIIDIMNLLGEIDRLVYTQEEILESSEAKSTVENRLKYLLNEICLIASFSEEQE
ncbi:hypothetical protein MBANPS3_002785, partial [Mucor bainieri]